MFNIQHKSECRTLTSCLKSTTSTPVTLNESLIIPRSHSLQSKVALISPPALIFMGLKKKCFGEIYPQVSTIIENVDNQNALLY